MTTPVYTWSIDVRLKDEARMEFVTTFAQWAEQLVKHKAMLDDRVVARLRGGQHPYQAAYLIRDALDRLHIDFRSTTLVDILTHLNALAQLEQDRNAYESFAALFDQYWNTLTQNAHEYFKQAAKESATPIEKFHQRFKEKLKFEHLFTIKAWTHYANSSINQDRFKVLSIISNAVSRHREAPVVASPATQVDTKEDKQVLALPTDIATTLDSMTKVMTQNCLLAGVDREKADEIKRIEEHAVSKVVHAQSRVRRELQRLLDVSALEWPAAEVDAFFEQVTRCLMSAKELVSTRSYRDTCLWVEQKLTECKAEEKEAADDADDADDRALRRAYMDHHARLKGREVTRLMIEYYNGNLMDVAAIRHETRHFGTEAAVLHKLLQQLHQMCTEQLEMTREIEGQSVEAKEEEEEEKKENDQYDTIYAALVRRAQQADQRLLYTVVLKEAQALLTRHKPTIMKSLLNGADEIWRQKLKDAIEFHSLNMRRGGDAASHQPRYAALRARIDELHQSLFRDDIKPKLVALGECMKLHLDKFVAIETELRSRVRSIQKGLRTYQLFASNTSDSTGAIPASWCRKLVLSCDKEEGLKLKEFKEKVYQRHLQSLKTHQE